MKEQRSRIPALLLFLVGALLLTYTSAKAYLVSFTHDESQTFLNFIRYDQWWFDEYSGISANNHPLNSLFMILSSKLFGTGEFALRLPNVIAHAGYLYFTALLALRYKNIIFIVSAFLLLNVNPFVLDFFSIARGYGISLCFLAGSLFFLSKALSGEKLLRNVVLSMLLALAGVLANLTLLNYMLVLSGVLVLAVSFRAPLLSKQWISGVLTVSVIMGLVLRFFIPVVEKLKAAGTLFFGGENGFWTDTVFSLIYASFRKPELNDPGNIFIIIVTCIAIIISLAGLVLRKLHKEYMMLHSTLLIILLCAASVIAQHHWMDTKFLLDRTGIFFIPLFMLLVCEVLNYSWSRSYLRWITPLLSLAFTILSISLMNLKSVLIWEYDADTKSMVNALEEEYNSKEKKELITVGTEFIYEPAITYYKVTRGLTWLNKVSLQPEFREHMDYCFLPQEAPPVPGMQLLRSFPSNSKLYKNTASHEWTLVMTSQQRFEKEDLKNSDPGTISEKLSYSGKSSGIIYPKNGSSLVIEDTLKANQAGSILKLHLKAMVLMENLDRNVQLVTSAQSPEQTTHWSLLPVRDHVNETGKWIPVNWIQFLPQPSSDNVLKAYFIGDSTKVAHFDDLELKVYKLVR